MATELSLIVAPARKNDATTVASRLRRCDLDEARIALETESDDCVRDAVAGYWRLPNTMAAFERKCGRPVALFGCVDFGADVGRPWMLGTDELSRHARALVVLGLVFTRTWQSQFRLLENWVWKENARALAWLDRLGYNIVPNRDSPMWRFYRV